MKRMKGIMLFLFSLLLIKCSKDGKPVKNVSGELKEFVHSPVYRHFLKNHPPAGKADTDAARIVRVDNAGAVVHIPVMKQRQIQGAIIGLPLRTKGEYELMYQDNRAALSGTGSIYLYTSSNELFSKINLESGVVTGVEAPQSYARKAESMRIDCNFFCRLSKCYNMQKAHFPTDPVCDLLDLFMGVCSSATVATCLIRMAIK